MHIENSGNEKGTSLEFSKGQFSKEKITKRIVHNEVKQEEEKILKFWDSEKIYEKSKKKNAKGNKFYFMDGPPYATGHIHMGTALNKTLKDIAMRAKRLQGFDVFDKAGYDTHGVPIEYQIEKEIGTKSKGDIEKYGVKKFVDRCKDFATKYIGVMNDEFKNLGVWMDFDNYYLTLSDEYIEAIWHTFKKAEDKGLLYLDKYPVHVCSRCGTAVAYNEVEYTKQKDKSVYVKFKLKKKENTYLIIWTTTPWTLPANTGVMVHPDVEYDEIELATGERWIVAKELVGKLMGKLETGFTLKKTYKGKEMACWEYVSPLTKHLKLKVKNAYKVVLSGRYVTTEDGTGLVHTAPGHGKEDYEVGKENGLDAPSPVGIDGLLTEEAGKYAGKKARVVDAEIIEDIEKENALVMTEEYEHDYPICWRDRTPLLMLSLPQWFLKISSFHDKLLEENEKVAWVPKWAGSRMKSWLEGVSDWPISRQRYWGTPLPIWFDAETGERIVVGTIAELEKLSGKKVKGLHKPEIDEIVITSPKTGKKLKRVTEVLDDWFDSGVSSWAALGYPRDEKMFKKYWPADLNIEGRDQFRGWWNSQMILSQIAFGKKPFDRISVHGMVLDLAKRKMSKSVGNIITPAEVIEKQGRDAMRYYLAKFSKGEDFAYNEREFADISKVFRIIDNLVSFTKQINKQKQKEEIEDKWIKSRFARVAEEVKDKYNKCLFYEAIAILEQFVVQEFSRGYIQMIRERTGEAKENVEKIVSGLLVLFAPIVPFMSERLWQSLKEKEIVKEESVHLADWPEYKWKSDEKLEKEFEVAQKVIVVGMSERDKAKIGLKWPLAGAVIESEEQMSQEVVKLVESQLNIKKIQVKKGKELRVRLDTNMTPELEAEGFARELSRRVQEERKKRGLVKEQNIELKIWAEKEIVKALESQKENISERTGSCEVEFSVEKAKENAIQVESRGKKAEFDFVVTSKQQAKKHLNSHNTKKIGGVQ